MFRHRKIRALAVNVIVIVIAAMITIMTTLASINELSVNAQMGNHGGVWAGNMTSGQQQQQQNHERRTIINGTINLEQTIFQAINSRINTSLTQAMSTAERLIGNDAFAV